MDAVSPNIGKRKLTQSLNKSLAKVRLSNSKRLTAVDKIKIKKAAVNTLQTYLKSELKKTSVKTYDWYFFKDAGQVYHIEAFRNNALQNRYFIVDHIEVPILSENAHGSTYGQQQVQQFDIASQQIGDIISSSKKLFADMMKITVSEKEDAKIWKAYDTVNEKKIITVTIGLPAAIILTAEAIPLMVMASKSSAASAFSSYIGKAFTLNSSKFMAINGGSNLVEQYVSNAISFGEFGMENLGKIDGVDVISSLLFTNAGSVPIKSAIDLSVEDGLRINSLDKFANNMISGGLKFKAGKTFGQAIGKPLGGLAPSVGGILNQGGQLTIKTTIESFKKKNEAKNK